MIRFVVAAALGVATLSAARPYRRSTAKRAPPVRRQRLLRRRQPGFRSDHQQPAGYESAMTRAAGRWTCRRAGSNAPPLSTAASSAATTRRSRCLDYSSEGLPPVGDVLVRMQMQANPDKLDAATFFKVPDPREVGVQVREHKQATVAGRPPSSGRSGGANRRSSSVRSRRSGGTCAVPSSTIGWS
jgi:hypothetical protein